jgi:hypothetical protein
MSFARRDGFDGVVVDRLGYPDRGRAVDAQLSKLLSERRSLESPNHRLVFFDLRAVSPGGSD